MPVKGLEPAKLAADQSVGAAFMRDPLTYKGGIRCVAVMLLSSSLSSWLALL